MSWAAKVSSLNASTFGWSISKTTVPSGQGSRQARASSPAARMTTWRMPSALVDAKNSSNHLVRAAAYAHTMRMRCACAEPAAPPENADDQPAAVAASMNSCA